MRGVITTRDVAAHSLLILREFGLGCLFRCVRAVLSRERTTFLDVAFKEPVR